MGKMLTSATTARTKRPHKVLVYGDAGVGKSTFGAGAPKPIFLASEDGLAAIEVPCVRITSFKDLMDTLAELRDEKHDYETIVIDSLDWCEPLVFAEVAKRNNADSVEEIPWGKGYPKVPPAWREIQVALERTKLNVIAICHRHVAKVQNPDGSDFSRSDLKLLETDKARTGELWREWADCVALAALETTVSKDDKSAKAKARTTGNYVMYTRANPARATKCRYPIADKLPLSWSAYETAVASVQPDELKNSIDKLISTMQDPTEAHKYLEQAGSDPTKLSKLYVWLKEKN